MVTHELVLETFGRLMIIAFGCDDIGKPVCVASYYSIYSGVRTVDLQGVSVK